MITIKTENHKQDWQSIRQSVFVDEQGFENEFDDLDEVAIHVVLYVDTIAVGCARTYTTNALTWHLGRLAIISSYRKKGYGAIIIKALEDIARTKGGREMRLSAQNHAIAFYQKQGYQAYGNMYMDEHVPHQGMEKKL